MDEPKVDFIRIKTADADYEPSLELMHQSFVDDERRADDELRGVTDGNPIFGFNVIRTAEGERVGFITTWNFGKCIYVEHFAIEPGVRGKGYGKAAIEHLIKITGQPIVLEVELPETSDEARRRVSFYERAGFCAWQTPYVQPPYGKGKSPIQMMLMTHNLSETIESATIVTALIHRHVYGVKNITRR